MTRAVLILGFSFGLIAANGFIHGFVTNRWSQGVDMAAVADAVKGLPLELGPWQGEPLELDPVVMRAAEAVGAYQALFVHKDTGQTLTALVLCGRPGPMSVHTPEYCYAGLGYRQQGDVERVEIQGANGKPMEFRKVVMVRETPDGVPEQIIVYHSWTDGSGWVTPALPRIVFADAPYLVKVYVATTPAPVGADSPDPAPEFIPVLCAEIERRLQERQLTP